MGNDNKVSKPHTIKNEEARMNLHYNHFYSCKKNNNNFICSVWENKNPEDDLDKCKLLKFTRNNVAIAMNDALRYIDIIKNYGAYNEQDDDADIQPDL